MAAPRIELGTPAFLMLRCTSCHPRLQISDLGQFASLRNAHESDALPTELCSHCIANKLGFIKLRES